MGGLRKITSLFSGKSQKPAPELSVQERLAAYQQEMTEHSVGKKVLVCIEDHTAWGGQPQKIIDFWDNGQRDQQTLNKMALKISDNAFEKREVPVLMKMHNGRFGWEFDTNNVSHREDVHGDARKAHGTAASKRDMVILFATAQAERNNWDMLYVTMKKDGLVFRKTIDELGTDASPELVV